jgi:hypothetical protein
MGHDTGHLEKLPKMRESAERARRLAEGVSEFDRQLLLWYAEDLERRAAELERQSRTQREH